MTRIRASWIYPSVLSASISWSVYSCCSVIFSSIYVVVNSNWLSTESDRTDIVVFKLIISPLIIFKYELDVVLFAS